jgi:hypothetical protein
MSADHLQIWPFLIAALAVLMIYRRLRRSFGRQPVRPARMALRIGILLLLGISLIPLALRSRETSVLEIAGAAAGIGLAFWGANRTRYERQDAQLYYVPHTYTGIAVSLLVLGRLVYRFVQVYAMHPITGAGAGGDTAPGFAPPPAVQGPVTVGLLCVLIGYYVCYYSVVLWKSKHIRTEDLEVSLSVTPPLA